MQPKKKQNCPKGSLTSVSDAYLELEILFGFKSDTAPLTSTSCFSFFSTSIGFVPFYIFILLGI